MFTAKIIVRTQPCVLGVGADSYASTLSQPVAVLEIQLFECVLIGVSSTSNHTIQCIMDISVITLCILYMHFFPFSQSSFIGTFISSLLL